MSVEDYVKIIKDQEQKINKAISNFKKTPKARITVPYIDTRLELLDTYWKTVETNHELILIESSDKSHAYFTTDMYDKVEGKYLDYKTDLKEALANIQPQVCQTSSGAIQRIHNNESNPSSAIKLPRIVLPVFSGNYLEWPTFHDLFESLINKNETLAAVQKLHYLKSHLSGEAEQLLRHIPITEMNYEQCWTQLKKRYSNKRYISSCILNRLINQKALTSESSYGVKTILDTTSECLNALSNININVSSWDLIIIHLVVQKLDQESRKQWEQKIGSYSDTLPSFTEFSTFLESRFRALEFLEPNNKREARTKEVIERPKVFSVTASTASVSCPFCAEAHLLYQCKRFSQESVQARRDFIKEKTLCFNCFGAKHSATQCKRQTACRRCGRRHHSLLHLDSVQPPSAQYSGVIGSENSHSKLREGLQDKPEQGEVRASNIVAHSTEGHSISKSEVMLTTALVKVENKGTCHTLRAFLDQGAQSSFVTERMVQLLRLHKIPASGTVDPSGLGGEKIPLTTPIKHMKVEIQDWPELKNLVMADPGYDTPAHVDMLLGAEVYGLTLTDGIVRNPTDTLTAQNTSLGWILSGTTHVSNHSNTFIAAHILDSSLNDTLRKFWEIETDQPRTVLSKEDQACEDHYASTTTRDCTGRYVVSLPFRDDDPLCQYGDSRKVALRRFHMLERKLDNNPLLKQEYSKVINEYLALNHMELIQDQQEASKAGCVYMPYHAVIRSDKSTSKVRIVFDCSSKGSNGRSLNDDLMVGPRLQPELRHIIMKWRIHPICFVADIIKMYRQVKVVDEHTDFQRILWRESSDDVLKDYRMLRVTFGVSSAPYLAVKSLQQVAKDDGKDYPLAAGRVLTDFYMDDFMSGCETDDEAIQIHSEAVSLLNKAGFELQKWASNSQQLMETIYPSSVTSPDKDIKLDDMIKILGLSWNHQTDSFHYKVNLPPQQVPITKRKILSDISRLFDPLGWISPVIIRAKIYMQSLWVSGHSWDEEVSPSLLAEWNEFREQLPVLNQFMVPRWLGVRQDGRDIQLHGYCDASNHAYSGVVYLRTVDYEGNVTVKLVTARTKVSPVRQISIPRLELSGAVLLSKLLAEVSTVLCVPLNRCRAWTDSTIVLAWLQGHPNRWTTFVANRVAEILSVLNNDQWAHIESGINPADCASRGMSPSDFIQFGLWVNGPAMLHDPNYQHPTMEPASTELESKPIKVHVCTGLSIPDPSEELPVWTKYSSLTKTVRVVAYCLRFFKKLKGESFPSYLTAKELDDALKLGIKSAQSSAFPQELSNLNNSNPIPRRSNILSLCPFLDEDGIMRTRGRIEQSDLSYNVKHPIIMPRDHHLSRLIVSDAHSRTLHGGPQLTLNYVRSKFLIVSAKSVIRHVLSKCVRCLKYKGTKTQPFMADLPSSRVTVARPFHRTGCDYAGPINIRLSKGRGCKSYKGYIALFICMVTRCIHLEAVSTLSTEGFLAAFRRFVARRGPCREIWSDNGSNFIGASKELRVLFQQGETSVMKEVAEALANEGTEWHFIPPRAPNFGGLWEQGVASTKYHLKRVLDGTTLTFEEITTTLAQIEACLNSRPMYQLPSNEVDASPLTPGHFLVGEALVTAPDRNYENIHISPLHRWQLTQKLMQQFWRKWSQEYLTTLYQRYKWTKVTPEPQVGDVVLVKEDDLPPSKWLYGLVQEKHPGRDNVTRVVTLKCKNSIFVRPVSKLIVLPVAN